MTNIDRARRLLGAIETLPPTATGAWRLEGRGTVLWDAGYICWANAAGSATRLSHLLRHQRNPPLPRSYLSELVVRCQRDGTPLGEALLSAGDISEAGLRSAILHQTTEAVLAMAALPDGEATFTALSTASYDRRFAFRPVEVYASLGSLNDRALAVLARHKLREVPSGYSAFAFVAGADPQAMVPIAVHGRQTLVMEDFAAADWPRALVAAAAPVADDVLVEAPASATGKTAVLWRSGDLHLVALAPGEPAKALLDTTGSTLGLAVQAA